MHGRRPTLHAVRHQSRAVRLQLKQPRRAVRLQSRAVRLQLKRPRRVERLQLHRKQLRRAVKRWVRGVIAARLR